MIELERHELAELRLSLAFLKMELVLLRLEREERANPRWYLQPRVPANNPRGGQWTDAVLPALGQLLRLAPAAVAALRRVARGIRSWLNRPPRRWSGRPSEERDFGDETQRIGNPAERRPEHAQLRFRSFREFKEIIGPAGEGYEWHHLVEQRLADNGRFLPEEIHNTDNIVKLPRDLHLCVNAMMSRVWRYSEGKTLRMWLEPMSFEAQSTMRSILSTTACDCWGDPRMKSGEIDTLRNEFITAVIAARDAYGAGSVPAHNRWFRRSDRAARKLIDRGEKGKDAVEALLGHAEPSVRLGAASYVLEWAPGRAILVVEDLLIWAKRDRSGDIFGEACSPTILVSWTWMRAYSAAAVYHFHGANPEAQPAFRHSRPRLADGFRAGSAHR